VTREHPGLPVTIVGHSMGGLISTAFVRERKPEILALVTSGPAVELGPAMRGPRAWLLRLLALILPRILMPAGLPADGLSRDPEVVRLYEADPLVDTRVTPRLAAEMTRAIARTSGGGAEIGVPVLLLHGGADPLCAASGSEAMFASLPAGSAPPSAIHVYPGLLHEIFNEPEQQEIFQEILAWLHGLSVRSSDLESGAA
jgi:alpha-beta hydrolase superfamily lysophospholipase